MLKQIRNALIEWVGTFAIRLIAPTLKMIETDESGLTTNSYPSKPVIYAFWHNRMFLMPYVYQRYLYQRQAVCLVSASQDGEMIARVLKHFGLETVRGSSSRRGKEAYRQLAENLGNGWDVAITPDGPRGPRYQAQLGVAGLAAFSGHDIIPLTYHAKWKIELSSWDGFIIPLPFSPCTLHFYKPIHVDETDLLEDVCRDLELSLGK